MPAPIAAKAVPKTISTIFLPPYISIFSFGTEGSEFFTSTYVKLSKVLNIMQTQ
jgi:hypothetical protein